MVDDRGGESGGWSKIYALGGNEHGSLVISLHVRRAWRQRPNRKTRRTYTAYLICVYILVV